jgi:sodium/potassium-transporting ATPase subunit alpha
MMKGAPEIVLTRCTTYMRNDSSLPIDEGFLGEQKKVYERIAGDGMRVLAFARAIVPAQDPSLYTSDNAPLNNLEFVGQTGLTDPPKDGVPEAITKCRVAGIRVFMGACAQCASV